MRLWRRKNEPNRRDDARDQKRPRATESTDIQTLAEAVGGTGLPFDTGASYCEVDVVESDGAPILGCRMFTIIEAPDGVFLQGSTGFIWHGPSLTAQCKVNESRAMLDAAEHLASAACTCGIYLNKGQVRRQFPHQIVAQNVYSSAFMYGPATQERAIYAYANCVGWGTVVEAEYGYRVEHCRIERLYFDTDCEWAAEGLAEFGVPLTNLIVKTPEEAADLMRQWLADEAA